MKKKKLVKGPWGFDISEDTARQLDTVLKKVPSTAYRKAEVVPDSTEIVAGERADISWITTDTLDKDGEVVLPDGIDLSQFQKNPVVTWAHDYASPPVGKAQWVKRQDNGFKAKTIYASRPEDHMGDWFPDVVYALVQQDILKGKSIGFLATSMRPPTEEEIAARPELQACRNVIDGCMVFEYAVAPVPCNPDALLIAKSLTKNKLLLTKLGIQEPKKKKVLSEEEVTNLVLKRLDVEAIAARVMDNIRNRGRV